jgi:hypothetical protein
LALVMLIPGVASAWWDIDHKTICEEALSQLTPDVRASVVELLDRPLPDACVWADNIKRTRPETRPWHYRNSFPGVEAIEQTAVPKDGDALSALKQQINVLTSAAPKQQRREALMWIGHLVGDLHQPFHVAYAEDLGGNRVYLTLPPHLQRLLGEQRDRVNMHAIWDGLISRYFGYLSAQDPEAAARIRKASNAATDWQTQPSLNPNDWANESIAILNTPAVAYLTPYRLAALTEEYLLAHAPTVITRRQLASRRLALLLTALLGAQ